MATLGPINDGALFVNIAATPAVFNLVGGYYSMSVVATGFGSVNLQVLLPDQTTYILPKDALGNSIGQFVANGSQQGIFLAAGTYKVVITSASAVYVSVARINT